MITIQIFKDLDEKQSFIDHWKHKLILIQTTNQQTVQSPLKSIEIQRREKQTNILRHKTLTTLQQSLTYFLQVVTHPIFPSFFNRPLRDEHLAQIATK